VVGQNNPALVALRSRREMVVDALSTHFANDVLDMDEFEQRVDLAHRCTSVADLDELLADLGPSAEFALASQAKAAQVAIAPRPGKSKRALSVLSSIQRKGTWRVPRKLPVVSVMGAVELDFREAEFDPGVTEVKVTAVMGAVTIVVPPHLQVHCNGTSIVGHFEGMDSGAGEWDPDAPLLRITGVAVMGSLEISKRLPETMMQIESGINSGQSGRT